MGAFDDFGKKISDFADSALQKGKDTAETLKLDMKIGEENDKLKNLYSELGKKYLEAHPEDFDESLYPEWQEKHLFQELRGETRVRFCLNMLKWLSKPGRDDYRGGISDQEIRHYESYMR